LNPPAPFGASRVEFSRLPPIECGMRNAECGMS